MANTPGAGWANKGVFQLGKRNTLAVSMDIHNVNRKKLCSLLAEHDGIVLLKGGEEQSQYDTDTELVFRQDSWFNYLFGVKEAGNFGVIEVATGKTTLFVPRHAEDYRIWCGQIFPPSHFKEIYTVDEVLYVEDLPAWIESHLGDNPLHLLEGLNTDSGSMAIPAHFEGIEKFGSSIRKDLLHHALATARVTKSPAEVELMRWCALVASNAHVEVMRATTAGMGEFELEATFLYQIYKNGGCRKSAYTSICACGPNSATLHYGHAGAPNDGVLLETDMALLDMGAEYHGYVSDITCSFPVSGHFSADQRAIFEGVAAAQAAVMALVAPGVSWSACHKAAEREVLKALLGVGVLVAGSSLEELEAADIGSVFFPHGLGHLIGCDTHDVGGYITGTPHRETRPGVSKLRTNRLLEAGMTLTNEPGCYFIDILLQRALANPEQARFIDITVLARFRDFGGVRLEDVFLVTDDGVINLTTCPRTADEVESVMSGGVWPPAVDAAPQLKRRWGVLAVGGVRIEDLTIELAAV